MNHLDWITLKSVPGIGNLLFKRLVEAFSSPENVLNASHEELCNIDGISGRISSTIRNHSVPNVIIENIQRSIDHGCKMIVMSDPEYPPLLREIPDPPPYLFVMGTVPEKPAIAIVGSRNATSYGLSTSRQIARGLGTYNCCVVSGLARGIDTAAHMGALDGNSCTVAVLGSGFGNIYPPENRDLAKRIVENGAVLSEFPFSTKPEPKNFPMRNRIISGMSLGTVVVEAAHKSGSLITARLAAEQNREVFAVPGSIRSFKSTGTHSLLKQGAKLVESCEDILEELPPLADHPQTASTSMPGRPCPVDTNLFKKKFALDFDEMSVIKVLDLYPVHIDEILQRVTMDPGTLSGILLKLELTGIVNQFPGKLFSINEDAH